ncbi:MAG: selenide, water dikinase SelD, partial [Desulfovibrionaceae bacterium]|nr:selenide, water dikinase SelD [Desulfovibrionaceae bacterium]
GGHTIQDEELKYGLSVTGIIDPQNIAANNHLKKGLSLILTKPLGIGILATAVKAKWEDSDLSEAEIISTSGRLNLGGAKAIQEFKLPAATDITGFGLLGHALELARASQVCLYLKASDFPLLPRVMEYIGLGLIPAGAYRNREHAEKQILVKEGVDPDRLIAGFDPQTSGGLLLAVPKDLESKVISFLKEQGDAAFVIGEVGARRDDCINIVVNP